MNHQSYLSNIEYINEIYQQYLIDPYSIDSSWRYFFDGFSMRNHEHSTSKSNINIESIYDEFKVLNLIDDYRKRGHLFTETNPVRKRRKYSPTLDIENYGLTNEHLNKKFKASSEIGLKEASLKEIIEHLKLTYCKSIGVEYMYIRTPEIIKWFKQKMEPRKNQPAFNEKEKLEIYSDLVKATFFEQFLHKKFIGQKRFSLEGVDAIIPALDFASESASNLGVEEIVLGMSHRGRLTVLANFLEKPLYELFEEYIGKSYDDESILGDVKYHLGYNNIKTLSSGKQLFISMLPNPSHLETVAPVALGFAKARILKVHKQNFDKLLPIVIHGDAAISAQGIAYETAQMSQLDGYGVGGTLHFVLNNQVGFTTNYTEGRSSTYSTDIAKVTQSPVFHVNADDPESLILAVQLAIEFRQTFHRDVYIDILGYRKYGHNEGDEPRFTQPTLYKLISNHKNVRQLYFEKLIQENASIEQRLREIENQYNQQLQQEFEKAQQKPIVPIKHFLNDEWKNYRHASNKDFEQPVKTTFPSEELKKLAIQINSLPEHKKFFSKAIKIVEDRLNLISNNKVDWALGEQLAFATLLVEGHSIRLSGQDSERGTFSHRHSAFVIEDTDEKYYPLKNISEKQAPFYVYNSLLSEYGVLGFEYGYSLANSEHLTIWEAQFGDFHNVGQVIIDQFISSAKDKWSLMSGLTLLLPHGYEGQGPEHSSARIERFLVLAANENMILANLTNPANLFHLLRRQVKAPYRLPLIIFTPKSALRHPLNISSIEELSNGNFQDIIDDLEINKDNAKQILLCSGKIYYELFEERKNKNIEDTAIIRIEQLYPLNIQKLNNLIAMYPNVKRIAWVQEEPANMGAWNFIRLNANIPNILGICRPASGSTAPGLLELHKIQQQKILDKAFGKCKCKNVEEYCYMSCSEKI
ncbi:MAG TPA: 2-oxoglutarate dehydrogenase E1 component [Bacteroidales bacterium]|nr:2-oxoglutarate dehydrogenase E1 component [Bacteroidales bacterium]